MNKPNSDLVFDIINFACNQKKVSQVLKKRDESNDAICTRIECRFIKKHPKDDNKAAYDVTFNYKTKNTNLEKNDDVLVRVVDERGDYKIVDIKYF